MMTEDQIDAVVAAQDAAEARWRALDAEAAQMVRAHVCFAKDGGVCRDSCWDNLQDTLVDLGRLDMFDAVEHAFARAWPSCFK